MKEPGNIENVLISLICEEKGGVLIVSRAAHYRFNYNHINQGIRRDTYKVAAFLSCIIFDPQKILEISRISLYMIHCLYNYQNYTFIMK